MFQKEPRPSLRKNPEEETLWEVLLNFFQNTGPGNLISLFLLLTLLTSVFNFEALGARSFIFLFLLIYLLKIFQRDILTPERSGEACEYHWFTLILLPCLVLGYLETTFMWKQHVASQLTKEISGNPKAWAQCQRFTPAIFADSLKAGFYAPSQDPDKAVIQYIYCQEWGNFYYSDRNSIADIQTLWAVGVVIHEAIHASGELNEATTQCLTMRAFPNILKQFGVREDKVQEYTLTYAQGTHRMPKRYLNGKCSEHPILKRVPHIFDVKDEEP